MKLFVISDIHGSLSAFNKAMDCFAKEKADLLVITGDYLYHGARNSLPEGYNPKELAEVLNTYKNVIVSVRGNCDSEVDQMVLQFPVQAPYAEIIMPISDKPSNCEATLKTEKSSNFESILKTEKSSNCEATLKTEKSSNCEATLKTEKSSKPSFQRIFIHHGHLYTKEEVIALRGKGIIVISGHTHISEIEVREDSIFVNPGSISLPKGGTEAGYAIIEEQKIYLKNLDGKVIQHLKYSLC